MLENPNAFARRIGITGLAALLALLASSAFAGPPIDERVSRPGGPLLSESSAGSLKRAVRAWHRDNYEMAIRHTDIALSHDPIGQDLELALAISCALRGEVGEIEVGLAHCDRLVELTGGREGRYLNSRANTRMRSGEVESAIEDYRAALALAREDASAGAVRPDEIERNLAGAMRMSASQSDTALASSLVR